MNPNMQQLNDSPVDMPIGDQVFRASVLTDKDYSDLENYAKAKHLENARKFTSDMDDDGKKEIMKAALEQMYTIEWGTDLCNDIIFCIDGWAHLGFQLIRRQQPNWMFSRFKSLFDGTNAIKQKKITEDEKERFILESCKSVGMAYNFLHPAFDLDKAIEDQEKEDQNKEGTGGSPAENTKSSEKAE